jgi:WD40 repeat protein
MIHLRQAVLVFYSNGTRLVIAAYCTVWIWDVQRVEELAELYEPADHAIALAVSPDGALLAVHHYNGVTRLWDLQTWELRAEWPEFNVREVAFSPDGTTLFTAAGPCIRAWDVAVVLGE